LVEALEIETARSRQFDELGAGEVVESASKGRRRHGLEGRCMRRRRRRHAEE
jgi:hypothetical protein